MANTSYTQVDTSQLNELVQRIKTDSQNISSAMTNYKSKLNSLTSSDYFKGVVNAAVETSCNRIMKTIEEFRGFSEELATKIQEVAQKTLDTDKNAEQKERSSDIFHSGNRSFGLSVFQPSIFCSSARQFRQMRLSLYRTTSSASPQNRQEGSYFFRITLSFSTKISTPSPGSSSSLLLVSIGSTIRPSSSTFRTIPNDFILYPPVSLFPRSSAVRNW